MLRGRRTRRKGPKNIPKSQLDRTERRLLAKNRRAGFILVGSIVLSGLILVAWFPANALYAQRINLATATRGLNQVSQQDNVLAHEQRRLMSSTEIGRMARERFQLVEPGQQAYQVLPPNWPSTSGSSTTISNRPYPGDPGLEPPVAPSAAAEVLPGSGSSSSSSSALTTTQTAPSSATTGLPSTTLDVSPPTKSNRHPMGSHRSTSGSIISRILNTLEFWH